jgi:hypothetical protein
MWYSMRREARSGLQRRPRVRSAEVSAAAMGSKVRPVCEGKDSRVLLRPGGARWEDLQEGFGKGEGFGFEGFEDGGEGFFLGFGGDDGGFELAVAAEVVAVVEAADLFGGGFGLVAFEQVEGDEGVFE